MSTLSAIVLSLILVSFLSLAGLVLVFIKKKNFENFLLSLLSLSAGTLLGGAFFHLLPEASLKISQDRTYLILVGSFIFYFLLEKLVYWHHCHKKNCPIHTVGYLNLLGDGIHNFLDGLVIASAYLVDLKLGLITTLAVAIHEIPQEIGDFGVLVYAGFRKKKALIANLLVGLIAVVGGIVGFFLAQHTAAVTAFLLPFAAGGFLYIAMTDLIPEIRNEKRTAQSLKHLAFFVLGLVLMYVL